MKDLKAQNARLEALLPKARNAKERSLIKSIIQLNNEIINRK